MTQRRAEKAAPPQKAEKGKAAEGYEMRRDSLAGYQPRVVQAKKPSNQTLPLCSSNHRRTLVTTIFLPETVWPIWTKSPVLINFHRFLDS